MAKGMESRDEIGNKERYQVLESLIHKDDEENPLLGMSFEDFVQDIFAKSYPMHNFNVWHIHYICAQVDRIFLKTSNKYLTAALPRYHLKSTILGEAASIYRMLTAYGDGMYISFKDELAMYHLSHIKEAVRINEFLSKYLVDQSTQSDSLVNYRMGNKRMKIFGSGIMAMKRGIHTDTIVVCLTPETEVLTFGNQFTSGGYKPISEIRLGDKVKTHLNRFMKVTNIFVRETNELIVNLALENGELVRITKNHRVLTNQGWKNAGELTTEDILMKLEFYKHPTKGKTYEEIFGDDKAARLKSTKFHGLDRSKQHKPTKGKKLEEYYGKEKSDNMREAISRAMTGKIIAEREERQCPNCKKYFVTHKISTKKFCSRKCNAILHKEGMGFRFRSKVGNFKLEKNPNWQGGKSFKPYPTVFDKDLKHKVRMRDDNKCQLCGEHGIIAVHHIDYNKNNCDEMNLIALCKNCNFKVNNNRNYWTEYFSDLMMSRFGVIQNGTRILKIYEELYSGKVFNLEVDEDNSYVGRGIIYHNCDDILGNIENPMVLTDIDKVKRLFNSEIMNIPNQSCPLFVFGTVMDYSDILFTLKENPNFVSIWLPAINPTIDREVLWPEIYGRQVLEDKKNSTDWRSFATEFLLTPMMATEAFFGRDQLDTVINKSLKNFQVPGF